MTEAIGATARWQSCAIVEVATRTPAIKSFFLRLSETFDYTAGQHVDVRLTAPDGYTAMRSYSIGSAPSVFEGVVVEIDELLRAEVESLLTSAQSICCSMSSAATSRSGPQA